MRLLWIATVLAVAGCASPLTHEQIQARARFASDVQLCRAAMMGSPEWAYPAREELSRRGFDCSPVAGAIIQADQAQRAAAARGLADAARAFQQPIYPMQPLPQPPQQINCRSYAMGGTLYTNCQ
jgi:hypothetical protein